MNVTPAGRKPHVDVIMSNRGDRHVIIEIRRVAECTCVCTCSFYFVFLCASSTIFKRHFQDEEREESFLRETHACKIVHVRSASNKIVLFSPEISNISPPIFVTEFYVKRRDERYSVREREREREKGERIKIFCFKSG